MHGSAVLKFVGGDSLFQSRIVDALWAAGREAVAQLFIDRRALYQYTSVDLLCPPNGVQWAFLHAHAMQWHGRCQVSHSDLQSVWLQQTNSLDLWPLGLVTPTLVCGDA
jgi:hypothetical protein